jgi:hypothetical protein
MPTLTVGTSFACLFDNNNNLTTGGLIKGLFEEGAAALMNANVEDQELLEVLLVLVVLVVGCGGAGEI